MHLDVFVYFCSKKMRVVCSNVHYYLFQHVLPCVERMGFNNTVSYIPAGVGIEVETFKGQTSTGIFVTPPKLNSSPLEP